jgi:hypothetical protein
MEQTTTMDTTTTNGIPKPRAYNSMTLGEIRTELIATFTAMLNHEADECLTSSNTKTDFDNLMVAAAAIIDLEEALHHYRYGDVEFDPSGKAPEEADDHRA